MVHAVKKHTGYGTTLVDDEEASERDEGEGQLIRFAGHKRKRKALFDSFDR